MSILESLFAGAKALVREVAKAAAEAVRIVLDEIDRSSFGRAATRFVEGATQTYFRNAADLAAEERELAAKYRRDGNRSATDEERLHAINKEREQLKAKVDAVKNNAAAEELLSNSDDAVAAEISDDEVSGAIGVIASKTCPNCGYTMRIREGGFNPATERRHFYWQCTSAKSCPTVKFDPMKERLAVVRKKDPNFDLSHRERREIWLRPDVLTETAQRLRQV